MDPKDHRPSQPKDPVVNEQLPVLYGRVECNQKFHQL